jgi:hypothetical protein
MDFPYQLWSERWNDLLLLQQIKIDSLEERLITDISRNTGFNTQPLGWVFVQKLQKNGSEI